MACFEAAVCKELKCFEAEELESATEGFAERRLLGKGSYGCVYSASLRNGRAVAVKRFCGDDVFKHESFERELLVLSDIRCCHVVELLGFCRCRDSMLVVELMEKGTLHEALHGSNPPPSWRMRLRFLVQVAKAIQTLHESRPQVIHRDIKSSNVLIDSGWNAKLSDFGLALRCGDASPDTPAGTLGYFDPRYESPGQAGITIDVFSFGVLLLDWALPLIKAGKLLSVCDPRVELTSPQLLERLVILAARCVRLSPPRRPVIGDVVHMLVSIRRGMSWPQRTLSRIRCL